MELSCETGMPGLAAVRIAPASMSAMARASPTRSNLDRAVASRGSGSLQVAALRGATFIAG
jgi:hypothetical protein